MHEKGEVDPTMAIPKIDPDLCTGCGVCETLCPEVFELGEDGLAHVLEGADCDASGCCEEAVDSCPDEAISLID
jgi:ferredoxin